MELDPKLKRISDGLVASSKKAIKRLRDKERTKDRENWRGVTEWPRKRRTWRSIKRKRP